MRWPALLLLLPSVALAGDVAPTRTRVNNQCSSYRMCDVETATGVCQDTSDTDEIVLHVGLWANYTFYSLDSVGSYSCDILTNNAGGAGAPPTSDQVNTTSITDEEPVYTMRVLLRYLWITCSEVTTSVTIDVTVCPL